MRMQTKSPGLGHASRIAKGEIRFTAAREGVPKVAAMTTVLEQIV